MNLTKIISVLLGLLAVAGAWIYHSETTKQLKGRIEYQEETIQKLVNAPPETLIVSDSIPGVKEYIYILTTDTLRTVDTVVVVIPGEAIDSTAKMDYRDSLCAIEVEYQFRDNLFGLYIEHFVRPPVLITEQVNVHPVYSWSIGGFILAGSRAYGGIYGSYGIGKLNVMTGVGLPGCMLLGIGYRGEIFGK